MQNVTNQSVFSNRFEPSEPTFLYTGSDDSYTYEFLLDAFDASPGERPKLSVHVERQLLEAKSLWESSPGHTRAELENQSRACEIVEQLLTCEFDTEGYEFFFSETTLRCCTRSLRVLMLDFTDGLIPAIPKATAEVDLDAWLDLPSSEYLEEWQQENVTLAGGIVLRLWNQAFLDGDQNFHHGPESVVYEIHSGAVKLSPFHGYDPDHDHDL